MKFAGMVRRVGRGHIARRQNRQSLPKPPRFLLVIVGVASLKIKLVDTLFGGRTQRS